MVQLLYVLFQITLIFPLLYVSQVLWKWFSSYDDQKIMLETKFSSAGLVYFSYMFSITIMSILAFHGANILLLSIVYVLNKSISYFYKTDVFTLIQNNNQAVGFIYSSILLSAAIQLVVSNYGKEIDNEFLFNISLPYFIFGQLLILLSFYFLSFKTTFNDIKEMENGNSAVSLYFAGIFLNSALLIGNVIQEINTFSLYYLILIFIYSFLSLMFIIIIPELLLKLLFNKNTNVEILLKENNSNVSLILFSLRTMCTVIVYFSIPFNLI